MRVCTVFTAVTLVSLMSGRTAWAGPPCNFAVSYRSTNHPFWLDTPPAPRWSTPPLRQRHRKRLLEQSVWAFVLTWRSIVHCASSAAGDGGWAELDKSVADGLAARGIPSVGWSSLRYYWTPRTPEAAANDLARIIRYYVSDWNVQRVILVGYSFGADVLPFLVNRLPSDALARVRSVALLGLSEAAAFEFRLASFLGGGGNSLYATAPEVERLGVPVVCVRSADEVDSECRELKGPHVHPRKWVADTTSMASTRAS